MPSAPAGRVDVVFSANATSYSAAVNKIIATNKQMGESARGAHQTSVSSMQATSASLRALHGGFENNLRAVERWISQSKTASAVAQNLFPVIGAATFGFMIVDLGAKLAAFIKKVNEMPKAIKEGFDSMHLSAAMATDQLKLTNDELQNSINKLQGKRQNNLAIQLDEARIKADDLAKSLEEDVKKVEELLAKNKVSGWAVLMGTAGTASVSGSVNSFNGQIADLGRQHANAVRSGDTDKADSLLKQIGDKQAAAIAWTKSQLFMRDNPQYATDASGVDDLAGNQANNRAILLGFQQSIADTQAQQAEKNRNAQLVAKDKQLQGAKELAAETKAADEKRLQAMTAALEAEKLQHAMSLKEVFDYWGARKTAFAAGSAAYNEVVAKQSQIAIEASSKAHEAITKYISESKRGPGAPEDMIRSSVSFNARTASDENQGFIDSNQLAIDDAHNKARTEEAVVTDAAGRSISKYAAALQLANIHAQEYLTVQTALQGVLNTRLQQQAANPSKESDRAVTEAQIALANASAARSVQAQSDSDALYGKQSSSLVGAVDAINDFVVASRNAAGQMRDLVDNTISGLNEQIVRAMSGQRTNFKGFGAGLFRGVATTGLEKGEGAVLGALGFGGKMGTQANPMWTKSADGTAGSVGGVASGIFGKLFGGSSQTGPGAAGLKSVLNLAGMAADDDRAGGGIGTIASSLTGLIPFLADGGGISGPAIVGERGPELFIPNTSGTIVPNHQLSSGSTGDTHFHVDARGSGDPAQVEAAVQRGIRAAAPHIAAAGARAVQEMKRRSPLSRR